MLDYFTLNSNSITKWKAKRLSNESLEVFSTSNNTLTPSVNHYRDKVRLNLEEVFCNKKQLHTITKKL